MGILDPKFKYTPAAATDIRKLFRRVREQMKAQAEKPKASVQQMKRRTANG